MPDWIRYSLFPKPAVLPSLQHLLLQPWSGLWKGPTDCQRERLSHSQHEGHAIKENGRREALVHPVSSSQRPSARLATSTVEAQLIPP